MKKKVKQLIAVLIAVCIAMIPAFAFAEDIQEHCYDDYSHSMPVGDVGQWFDSKQSFIDYYNSIAEEWNTKLDNGQISIDEYYANVPRGYECWSCSCGKWTGNFKYKN